MRRNKLSADNHGFSLVEILIAMVILAIIVVPLLYHLRVPICRQDRHYE